MIRFSPLMMLLLWGPVLVAQPAELPLTTVSLQNVEAFQAPDANWKIVGDVYADREKRHALVSSAGTGVLANHPTEQDRGNLFTAWEHGDIELELEFMMARGSNAGVYLQGRYEIQMLDSWGVQYPKFSDCGGIYERWDEKRADGWKGYEGHAPRMNASRAPGLWQHFKIFFQAPRFDAEGKKVANARFLKVVHNGVVIHENVEVTGPTRAAAFDDEQPMGPLMVQGDHGPVALRNIRYKRYGGPPLRLENLSYIQIDGDFDRVPDFSGLTPGQRGNSDGIIWDLGGDPNQFAARFDGSVQVPRDGLYQFHLHLGWISGDPHFRDQQIGGGMVQVGDQTALVHPGKQRVATGAIELDAGTYPFRLSYYKNRRWSGPAIVLYAEGPGMPLQTLNAPIAVPEVRAVSPNLVEPHAETLLHRSFILHEGRKKTHVLSVGEPGGGPHYTMDLDQGALLQVWRGRFLDATPMWHSRGQDQLATPQGSMLALSGAPAVARLPQAEAAWPSMVDSTQYTFHGYELNPRGQPTFYYKLGDLNVADQVVPDEEGITLVRTLTIHSDQETDQVYVRVAEGEQIEELPDGSYAVDGKRYILLMQDPSTGKESVKVRHNHGRYELLADVVFNEGTATIKYQLIW